MVNVKCQTFTVNVKCQGTLMVSVKYQSTLMVNVIIMSRAIMLNVKVHLGYMLKAQGLVEMKNRMKGCVIFM